MVNKDGHVTVSHCHQLDKRIHLACDRVLVISIQYEKYPLQNFTTPPTASPTAVSRIRHPLKTRRHRIFSHTPPVKSSLPEYKSQSIAHPDLQLLYTLHFKGAIGESRQELYSNYKLQENNTGKKLQPRVAHGTNKKIRPAEVSAKSLLRPRVYKKKKVEAASFSRARDALFAREASLAFGHI